MTVLAGGEVLTIGEQAYYVGERVRPTREAIVGHQALRTLFVAQRFDASGEMVVASPAKFPSVPAYPSDEILKHDPDAKQRYQLDYNRYLESLSAHSRPDSVMSLAQVKVTDNPSYFQVLHQHSTVPTIIPYETPDYDTSALFHLLIAEIV